MCVADDSRPPLPPIRGAAVDARRLTLTAADGATVPAFAARAEWASGAGVVVIPDVRGLHPFYEELALRFAEAGVDAVAVDFFGRTAPDARRGEGFDHEPHVMQLRDETVDLDVAAGVAHLRSPEGGEPRRIFTIGFCLGGRISFLEAATGQALAGVIGLYGWPVGPHRSGLPAPAAEAPRFGSPVLAIYGGADQGIPAEARAAFDAALDAAGVPRRTVTYDGAPHSFFDRKASEYEEESDRAWREVLAFMGVEAGDQGDGASGSMG